MKKFSFLLFLVLIFFVNIVSGQTENTQTIRGKIIDSKTEDPIIGASVIISNSKPLLGTVTDVNGKFRLENIGLGRQGIQVSFIGYNPVVIKNLTLVKGKQTVLDIKMEESVTSLEEITITAKTDKTKVNNEMATVSARSFSVEETERYAGSLGDPSRMASNFAGVMSVADQRNDIIIRGNSPFGLLWRLDGIDIPNPNHFGSQGSTGGPVSMLNNNLLSNSDFFTGAFPAEYGNAMSGVFDLNMRNGNNEEYEFLGQVGFNGFEIGAEGPINKKTGSSFIANFRYSTLEVMSKLGMDMGTGASVPQYKDLTFKINFPRGKFGKLSIFGIGGLSYIEMLDSEGNDAEFGFGGTDLRYGSDMGVIGINHTTYLKNNTRIITRLSVLGTKITTKIDSLDENYNYDFLFYQTTTKEVRYNLALELHKKFNSKNFLKIGMKYKLFGLNYKDSAFIDNRYIRRLELNDNLTFTQVFTQFQHKFSDDFSANIGVYSQYLPLNESFSVEPRAGVKWNIKPKHSISFGFGMHSQMQILPFYFMKDTITGDYSNQHLDFNKSIHGVIAYDFVINQNFRFKMEAYYQAISNVPVSEEQAEFSMLNTGDDFTSFGYNNMKNEGTGTNYGLEFTLEKFFSKGFYFLVTTSLFESKYKGFDEVERDTKFNGNYVYNALGGYEFGIGKNSTLAFDLKGVYAGGKRYIPIDIEKSIAEHELEYDWTNPYDKRFDDYFRLNARITFKLNSKKMALNQEWALDIQNITNHQNVYSQRWDDDKSEVVTDYQQGFFPMITYRILF